MYPFLGCEKSIINVEKNRNCATNRNRNET